MKQLYFFTISLFMLAACTFNGEFREIETGNTFSMSFPDYMKPADDLKEDAELQYSSPYRNTYAIVEKDEKNGLSFSQYQKDALDVIKDFELLKNPLVTDSIFVENEQYKAIHVQLYGLMDDENIYYWHSTYETADYFYQLAVWTRSMDRKQRYGEDIDKIIESFTPLQ
ncbi:MAG: hypothetical protein ACPG4Z_07715 [Chitinophagales bacterium]